MPSSTLFEEAAKAFAPAPPPAPETPPPPGPPAPETKAAAGFSFGSASSSARNVSAFPYLGDGLNRGPRFSNYGSSQQINYAAKVGDFWKNNSVFTALNWIRRNFPDARPAVQTIATKKVDTSHPMAMLLTRPNPNYSYSTLSAGVVLSYVAEGNAYLFKVRNGYGDVVQLWYRPHWMVRPVREPGSGNFIDYYLYKPDAATPPQKIPVTEVVHLRNGIDPENELLGMSDLKRLLLSIYTEQEAQRFIAAMLTKLGVPGVIMRHKPPTVNEKEGKLGRLTQEQAEAYKAKYNENFTGDNAGGALILDGFWEVDFPDVAIDASFFERAKDISQADIGAAIGIPPVVLGWHVGLRTASAKASHEDSRKQAYRECLMPMHRSMAEDYDIQLLPDFADNQRFRTVYDYSDIATLADDANARAERTVKLYSGGVTKRSEARQSEGLTVTPEDDIYCPKPGSAPAADPAANDPANPNDPGGKTGGKNKPPAGEDNE